MAATAAPTAGIRIDDPTQQLSWYAVEGAEYGFCRSCGSSLFWKAAASATQMSICAGSLNPPTELRTVEAWWASQASDYFQRPDLQERWTE